MFGELSILLDQPQSADFRAVEPPEFPIADAALLPASDTAVALYVVAILARRLDTANQALIEVKCRLKAGDGRGAIGRSVERVEQL